MSFVNIYDMEELKSDTGTAAGTAGTAAGTTGSASGAGSDATETERLRLDNERKTAAEEEKIKKDEEERIRLEKEQKTAADAAAAAAASAEEKRKKDEAAAAAGSDVAVIGTGVAKTSGAPSTASGAASTGSGAAAPSTAADAPPTKPAINENIVKYAIIEINDKIISVTDDATGLNTDKTPREYITEGANCKFALQILKKDCTTSDDMCIDFEKSNYLLNLNIKVPKETDFSKKLIDEEFLKPAASTASASTGVAKTATSTSDATSAPSAAATSATTVRIDIITQLQDMELLDFYFKSDIDKSILTKEATEEDIQKLIEEIFKKIDKTTTKTEVTNKVHGNFGLPNIGKVCYISSLIHLLKDIKTYKPVENDSNPINSLTAKLFKYIETGDKDKYEDNYNALVTAFGIDPTKEGDPNDVLNKYTLGDTVTIENIVLQDVKFETVDDKSIQDVFNEKKKTLTTDYGIFTINRNVNDQPKWETFDTTPPANYELAGKILNPPSHFVYINYDDQNKPIVYDDSRAEEFKDSSEKEGKKLFAPSIEKYDELLTEYKEISEQIFKQVGKTLETLIKEYQAAEQIFLEENQLYKSTNYDEQRFKMQDKIVTMVLYRKKEASGGSRKNRQQKSKKTKRNYYTYKK